VLAFYRFFAAAAFFMPPPKTYGFDDGNREAGYKYFAQFTKWFGIKNKIPAHAKKTSCFVTSPLRLSVIGLERTNSNQKKPRSCQV